MIILKTTFLLTKFLINPSLSGLQIFLNARVILDLRIPIFVTQPSSAICYLLNTVKIDSGLICDPDFWSLLLIIGYILSNTYIICYNIYNNSQGYLGKPFIFIIFPTLPQASRSRSPRGRSSYARPSRFQRAQNRHRRYARLFGSYWRPLPRN